MSSNNNETAIPHGSPTNNDIKRGKQGHSFLFCLCDMRRAVIMIDILCLLGAIIGLIIAIVIKEDDNIRNQVKIVLNNYSYWTIIGIQATAILAFLVGIIGAFRFRICPILMTCLWNIVYIVLCVLDKNWFEVVFHAICLYPHNFLCHELVKGIMTKENYVEYE